jgi:hypothetical protein
MKSTAVVRVVAYRCLTDFVDDHVCIGEDTILEAVQRYTLDVIEIFGQEYLRAPYDEDTERFVAENAE